MAKTLTIVLKPGDGHELHQILNNLYTCLQNYPATIQFLDTEEERVKQILPAATQFASQECCYNNSDLLISLGGDGTLIGASRVNTGKIPPIFGINMGRLGFITEFTEDNFETELDAFFNNMHQTQSLPIFKLNVFENEKSIFEANFVNDAVIGRCDISRMVSLTVETKTEKIFNLAGDGLIISSPVGSTAYSLSAGGPIVHPEVDSLLLTAICPHTLSSRPIVIPSTSSLTINSLEGDYPVSLTLDGQEVIQLEHNRRIMISATPNNKISLIKNPQRTYFKTLREKFTHGGREY